MSRNARLWVGVTLFIIIALNYSVVGFPLLRKEASLKDVSKAIYLRQIKSPDFLKGSKDEYILEVFRKEKASIERGILLLNSVAISLSIVVASWVVFGLIVKRK